MSAPAFPGPGPSALRRSAGRPRWIFAILVASGLLLWGAGAAIATHRRVAALDGWGDENVRVLEESVKPDPRKTLVGPWEFSLEYAFVHHPMRWAFLPRNRFTLDLLARATPIGTVLFPVPRAPDGVAATDLRRIGLRTTGRIQVRGQALRVFRSADASSATPTAAAAGRAAARPPAWRRLLVLALHQALEIEGVARRALDLADGGEESRDVAGGCPLAHFDAGRTM